MASTMLGRTSPRTENALYVAGGHGCGLKQSLSSLFAHKFDSITVYTWTALDNEKTVTKDRRFVLKSEKMSANPHGSQTFLMDVVDTKESKAPAPFKQAKKLDRNAPGTLFVISRSACANGETVAKDIIKRASNHFFARKPDGVEPSRVTTAVARGEKLFPIQLLDRNGIPGVMHRESVMKVFIFPGLWAVSVPVLESIPWPDIMAPQRAITEFGLPSNGDRQVQWCEPLAKLYAHSVCQAAWDELQVLETSGKLPSLPTEQAMFAAGVFGPMLSVTVRWLWKAIRHPLVMALTSVQMPWRSISQIH